MTTVARKLECLCSKLHLYSPFGFGNCGISTCQIRLENTSAVISKRTERRKTIIEAIGGLTPHQKVSKFQEDESDNSESSSQHKTQANNSYSSFPYLKPAIEQALIENPTLSDGENETTNTVNVVKVLHGNVGLGVRAIANFFRKHPEVFEMSNAVLESKIENLRSLKLRDGVLQRAISRTPKLLEMPEAEINSVASYLTGDLDFTVKELSDLFVNSPQVFLDPLDVTDNKFQYIFFTMGYKQHETLSRHGVMRHSLGHIRTRHLFLARRGQYQLPDKKGSLTIKNPKIRQAICSDDSYFCREVALCKLEEYKFFKMVLVAEDAMREKDSEPDDLTQRQDFADKLLKEMS